MVPLVSTRAGLRFFLVLQIAICALVFRDVPATAQVSPDLPNLLFTTFAYAQPQDRVSGFVDDERRVTLRGNRHPLAIPRYDAGRVSPGYRMDRIVLTLQPDPAQLAALDELLEAQHDPDSPYYQQWLTPEQYGERFGVSESDAARVTDWLQAHGMQVEEVAPGRRSITFDGNAEQVNSAFHTEIHAYKIGGEVHHANASDPEIPAALASVIGGIVSLHDFRSAPMHNRARVLAPDFTNGGDSFYLAPGDFATIYDLGPLYQQSINGSGQAVAIVARSNIRLSDVRQFRTSFGLPANDPQIIVNGSDPGILSAGEETEADLDAEWAGAVARNSVIRFVVSKSTNSSDGTYLSAQYIVSHNLAPVMSMSFGLCESALGSSGNKFISSLWQQAAAQGITVFVSSGDSGAAGCDSASSSRASHGLAVNGLCSTPYSVCVGGTKLNDLNSSLYWSPKNASGTQSSALSYIPEVAWNESSAVAGLWSSGGGASGIYGKPLWQSGTGVPADSRRDVPDVSFPSAGHDGYMIYQDGEVYVVGGTSAATPAFAGVMALIVQSSAARQGNANTSFYRLAAKQKAGGAAVFHDIVGGNNSVPGQTGFNTATGYDLVTGLGSIDALLLVNHWTDATIVPKFHVTASSNTLMVSAGSSTSLAMQVVVSNGFDARIAFSVSGLPTGVSATLTPAALPAPGVGGTILKLSANNGVKAGIHSMTVMATGGGVKQEVVLSVKCRGHRESGGERFQPVSRLK